MTDIEKLKALLKEFGIEYKETLCTSNNEEVTEIKIGERIGNTEGYIWFFCYFIFKKDGKFDSVGVWE